MNKPQRTSLMLAMIAGIALVGAGCSDRDSTNTSAAQQNRSASTTTLPADSATSRSSADASTRAGTSSADSATTRAGTAVDDTMITTSVKAAVLAEPGLASLKIDVDTKDGVVTLSGTVNSTDLKSRATQIAQNTNGVRSVIDNLAVKTG